MTVDELVQLLEEVVSDVTLGDMRQGLGPHGNLSDEGYVLLIRFLAGERPEQPARTPFPNNGTFYPKSGRHDDPTPADEDEQERMDRLVAELEASERQNPEEPLVLGGEFTGIQLP